MDFGIFLKVDFVEPGDLREYLNVQEILGHESLRGGGRAGSGINPLGKLLEVRIAAEQVFAVQLEGESQ